MAIVVSGWAVEVARILSREIVLLVADHCCSMVEKVAGAIYATGIWRNDGQACVCLSYQKMKRVEVEQ